MLAAPPPPAAPSDAAAADRAGVAALRWYLSLIKRRAWLLAVVALLAGALAYAASSRLVRPTYEATATMEVDVAQVGADISGTSTLSSQNFAETESRLVVTRPVAAEAYKALALRPPMTPASLVGMASATPVTDTQLILLNVTAHDPVLAARVANAMALAAERAEQRHQMGRFDAALGSISRQIQSYRRDIASLSGGGSVPADAASRIHDDRVAIVGLRAQGVRLQSTEAQAATTLDIRVPAGAPRSPISPRPLRDGLLAAALALVLAASVVLLREYLVTTLRSPEELTEALGRPPLLGSVLRVRAREGLPALVVSERPRSPTAEAYRVVRTNLLYAGSEQAHKVILVTSAGQAEGKTTTALNLAASLAEVTPSVLLLDGDLRRPSLHSCLGIDNHVGLTTSVVSGGGSLDVTARPTSTPNLFVMSSGPLPPNPAEVLGSRQMRETLESAGRRFEIVVIDSPPILAVADALILATLSDAVLLVVDPRSATRQAMSRAVDALAAVGARISGVVLNKVPPDRASPYYRYSYGPGSYGYVARSSGDGRADGRPAAKTRGRTGQRAGRTH